MPGMKLVIELDDRGSIVKVNMLERGVGKLEKRVRGGAANIAAGTARIQRGFSGLAATFSRMAMMGKLALGALAVASIVVGAKFEQSMANVISVAGGGEGALAKLSATARAWGAQTAFSASQAAEGMYSLASAGLKVFQIKDTIGGVLMYAGAAATSLGEAAEATVQTMKMFGLQATDTNRIVNVFASGIANSMLTAERLKEAMAAVGATAAAMGMTLEGTVGTIGLLHNAGMLGAVAGTRLKNVLSRLAQEGGKVKELMGSMVFSGHNLGEIMQQLADRGTTAGEVFTAFGRIAAPAVLTMMRAGVEEMDRMVESVTGTQKAWEMYEIQMNTISSQFKIFKSAIQENMIATFMALKPVLKDLLGGLLRLTQEAKPYVIGLAKAVSDFVTENKEALKGLLATAGKALIYAAAFMMATKAVGILVAAGNILWGSILIGVGTFKVLRTSILAVRTAAVTTWFYMQLGYAHMMASLLVQTALVRTKLIATWIAVHLAAIGPWGWLVIAVAAVVAGIIVLMYKYRDKIKEVMGVVANAFGSAWSWIKKKADVVGTAIKDAFRKPIDWIIDKIRWLAEKLGWLMDKILPGWKEKLGGVIEVTKDAAGKVGEGIEKVAGAVVDGTEWIYDASKWQVGQWADKGAEAASALADGFNILKDKAGGTIDAIRDKLDIQKLLGDFMAQIKALGSGEAGMDISLRSDQEPDWTAIWNAHFEKRKAANVRLAEEDFATIEAMADHQRAVYIQTLADKSMHEAEWLLAKRGLLDAELEYELDSVERTESEKTQLTIDHAQARAEARMDWEDAVLDHWMNNNRVIMLGLDTLGAAYDTFFATLLDAEMTGKQRREAMWRSMQQTFLRGVAEMFKQWLIMQLQNIIISNAAAQLAAQATKVSDSKMGARRAFSAYAAVPIVGPALGAQAAATAFAMLMAFHSGGMIPGTRNDMVVNAQGGEHMTRRGAVNSGTQPVLEYINATGRVPEAAAPAAPISLYFNVFAGGNDTDGLQEFIEDDIVPRIEDYQNRGGYKPKAKVVLT